MRYNSHLQETFNGPYPHQVALIPMAALQSKRISDRAKLTFLMMLAHVHNDKGRELEGKVCELLKIPRYSFLRHISELEDFGLLKLDYSGPTIDYIINCNVVFVGGAFDG